MPQTSACIFSQVLSVQTLPGKTDDTDIDLKKKKKKQEATGHWIRRKCYVIQVYSHDLLIL